MILKYILVLLLVSPMIMQASDPRSYAARKALQEKLKKKADPNSPEGQATLARIDQHRQDFHQGQKQLLVQTLREVHPCPKGSSQQPNSVLAQATMVVSDPRACQDLCDSVCGTPGNSLKKFDQTVKKVSATVQH